MSGMMFCQRFRLLCRFLGEKSSSLGYQLRSFFFFKQLLCRTDVSKLWFVLKSSWQIITVYVCILTRCSHKVGGSTCRTIENKKIKKYCQRAVPRRKKQHNTSDNNTDDRQPKCVSKSRRKRGRIYIDVASGLGSHYIALYVQSYIYNRTIEPTRTIRCAHTLINYYT